MQIALPLAFSLYDPANAAAPVANATGGTAIDSFLAAYPQLTQLVRPIYCSPRAGAALALSRLTHPRTRVGLLQVPPSSFYTSLVHAPTVAAAAVAAYNVTGAGAVSALTMAYSGNATHALPISVASALSALYTNVAAAQNRNGTHAGEKHTRAMHVLTDSLP